MYVLVSGIAVAAPAISPIATHFLRSIVCLCLSHSCALLKPLDGFKCYLSVTFVGFGDTLCQMGSLAKKKKD